MKRSENACHRTRSHIIYANEWVSVYVERVERGDICCVYFMFIKRERERNKDMRTEKKQSKKQKKRSGMAEVKIFFVFYFLI